MKYEPDKKECYTIESHFIEKEKLKKLLKDMILKEYKKSIAKERSIV